MARLELKPGEGQRLRFHATFGRQSRGRGKVTLLLKDVTFADGRAAADHVWFKLGKTWEALNLRQGDRIAFEARIKTYTKGYRGARAERAGRAWSETDFKLSHPSKATVLLRSDGPALTVRKPQRKKRRTVAKKQGSKARTRGRRRGKR